MLVISETASVTGEVHADHIIINGAVTGPIHARVMLELQPKARIQGDVHYTALEMHQGAIISGQLRPMIEGEEKPTLKLAANNA
jgi:cytoskeletal protein CcmA (bactofilin family)